MAKNKGKSQRRRQGWEKLHRQGHARGEDAANWDRLTRRKVKLPGQKVGEGIFTNAGSEGNEADGPASGAKADGAATPDAQAAPMATDPSFQRIGGTVFQLYPGGAWVRTIEFGPLMCGLAGTFRPTPRASALAVGDEVVIALLPETTGRIAGGDKQRDGDRVEALIEQRAARRSVLSRPQPMRGKWRDQYNAEVFEKILAANVDQVVLVCAVANPPIRRRLVDRFLVIAERGELELKLLVNKIDLGEPDLDLLAEYERLDVSWTGVSAAKAEGLDRAVEMLRDRTSVLCGASGVGKSSLLNALAPELELATREVRSKDNRGRHTTTAATLYELPFGRVIDTPGIRELGIEIDPAELPWYFPEIAAVAPQCRFRNCTHTHEPDCAVMAAAESGEIPPIRYDSYLRILDSLG